MLNNDYFYYSTIKKYVFLMGSVFNNLIINRNDSSNNVTQIVNVPIQYAKKEKMLTRVISDPAINREDAIILPVISFEIKDIVYDTTRKFNTIGRNFTNLSSSNSSVTFNYNPVPYDIHFEVYIYVKNNEDGTKILEQILPFFTPDFTIRAIMFPDIPPTDVPIILNGVRLYDDENSNFKNRSVIIWVLGFTLKGAFYGPIKTSPVINLANVGIYVSDNISSNNYYKNFGMEDISNNSISSNAYSYVYVSNTSDDFIVTTTLAPNADPYFYLGI